MLFQDSFGMIWNKNMIQFVHVDTGT